MRGIETSLTALLSILLVSAPVSAWACDFSCSSHQVRSDCHTPTTTSKDDTAMSMPPGMDMGSDQSEGSMGPNTVVNAMSGHSMSMSPQQEMVNQRFEQTSAPEMKTGATQDHSKSVSSCTHETCSQVSTSASPPRADHSQPNSLHRVGISISSPANLWISFHWIGPGTPPPQLLTADRLVTILRI
jgi:hypothetical protein